MRSEDVELEAILTEVNERRIVPETPIYRLRHLPTKPQPKPKRRAPARRATRAPFDVDKVHKHD
ncbi:hypothetical protein NJBCHELONAE_02000 [Mycobacteroides chelonae]|uniref:hypothetical protein n=1 Tax=Mycobacteroides chelonae TaxID=1774 RepID=UPI0021DD16AF|nr:hypothetical protein [Mycobacteroides chelonae]GLE54889.1 hypothetical protein NJBCHELONAE_02000 [Mycobacteroides chelonae]